MNRIGEMVSEFGNTERCFSSCYDRGMRNRTEHEEQNMRNRTRVLHTAKTQNFFFVPRLWQDEKNFSLFLYRAQNLPISLILFTTMTLSTLLIQAVCRTLVI